MMQLLQNPFSIANRQFRLNNLSITRKPHCLMLRSFIVFAAHGLSEFFPLRVRKQKEPLRRLRILPFGNTMLNPFIPTTTADAAAKRLPSACRPRATIMLSH